MHDKHGKALHPGDRVRTAAGVEFHIHDYEVEKPGKMKHKGTVAFASDVELVEQHANNATKDDIGGGCIIWGNGPPE